VVCQRFVDILVEYIISIIAKQPGFNLLFNLGDGAMNYSETSVNVYPNSGRNILINNDILRHETHLSKCCPYMPAVNFKRVQLQNNTLIVACHSSPRQWIYSEMGTCDFKIQAAHFTTNKNVNNGQGTDSQKAIMNVLVA
jgi:hypothetical protein